MPHNERDFFLDNLLVRIHFIIEMIGWTGLGAGTCHSFLWGTSHPPSNTLGTYGTCRNTRSNRLFQMPWCVPQVTGFRRAAVQINDLQKAI